MNKTIIIGAALIALAATAPAMAESPTTDEPSPTLADLPWQVEFRLDEYFLDVHFRTTERLIQCHQNASVMVVTPQVFADAGYSLIEVGMLIVDYDPMMQVRLRQDGDGTLVSLKTSYGTAVPEGWKKPTSWMEYWVRGGKTCFEFSFSEPIPAL